MNEKILTVEDDSIPGENLKELLIEYGVKEMKINLNIKLYIKGI